MRIIPIRFANRPATITHTPQGRTVIARAALDGQPDWAGCWLVRTHTGAYALVTDYGTMRTCNQDEAARIEKEARR